MCQGIIIRCYCKHTLKDIIFCATYSFSDMLVADKSDQGLEYCSGVKPTNFLGFLFMYNSLALQEAFATVLCL